MDETDQEKKKEKEPEEIDSDAEEDKSNSIDKELERKEEEVIELSAKIFKLSDEVKDKEKTLHHLKIEIRMKRKRLEDLSDEQFQKLDSNEQMRTLEDELEVRDIKIRNLNEELITLQSRNRELLVTPKVTNSGKKSKVVRLGQTIHKLNQSNEETYKKTHKRISEDTKKIIELQDSIAQLKKSLREQNSTIIDLEKVIEQKNEKIEQESEVCVKLDNENAKKQEDYNQILGEINSNKLKIQELEDDRFDLEKKLKSYEDVDGTIKSYEKEIEMNNLEFEKLQLKLESLRSYKEKYCHVIESIEDFMNKTKNSFKKRMEVLDNVIEIKVGNLMEIYKRSNEEYVEEKKEENNIYISSRTKTTREILEEGAEEPVESDAEDFTVQNENLVVPVDDYEDMKSESEKGKKRGTTGEHYVHDEEPVQKYQPLNSDQLGHSDTDGETENENLNDVKLNEENINDMNEDNMNEENVNDMNEENMNEENVNDVNEKSVKSIKSDSSDKSVVSKKSLKEKLEGADDTPKKEEEGPSEDISSKQDKGEGEGVPEEGDTEEGVPEEVKKVEEEGLPLEHNKIEEEVGEKVEEGEKCSESKEGVEEVEVKVECLVVESEDIVEEERMVEEPNRESKVDTDTDAHIDVEPSAPREDQPANTPDVPDIHATPEEPHINSEQKEEEKEEEVILVEDKGEEIIQEEDKLLETKYEKENEMEGSNIDTKKETPQERFVIEENKDVFLLQEDLHKEEEKVPCEIPTQTSPRPQHTKMDLKSEKKQLLTQFKEEKNMIEEEYQQILREMRDFHIPGMQGNEQYKGISGEHSRNDLDELEKKSVQLTVRLFDTESQLRKIEREKNKLQKSENIYNRRIQELADRLQVSRKERGKERTLLEGRNKIKEKLIFDSKKKIITQETAIKEYRVNNAKLIDANEFLESTIKDIRKNLDYSNKKNVGFESLFRDQKSFSKTLEQDKTIAEQRFTKSELVNKNQKSRIAILEEEIWKKESDNLKKETRLTKMNERFKIQRGKIVALNDKMNVALQEQMLELTKRFEEKEKEIMVLKEMLRSSQNHIKAKEQDISRYKQRIAARSIKLIGGSTSEAVLYTRKHTPTTYKTDRSPKGSYEKRPKKAVFDLNYKRKAGRTNKKKTEAYKMDNEEEERDVKKEDTSLDKSIGGAGTGRREPKEVEKAEKVEKVQGATHEEVDEKDTKKEELEVKDEYENESPEKEEAIKEEVEEVVPIEEGDDEKGRRTPTPPMEEKEGIEEEKVVNEEESKDKDDIIDKEDKDETIDKEDKDEIIDKEDKDEIKDKEDKDEIINKEDKDEINVKSDKNIEVKSADNDNNEDNEDNEDIVREEVTEDVNKSYNSSIGHEEKVGEENKGQLHKEGEADLVDQVDHHHHHHDEDLDHPNLENLDVEPTTANQEIPTKENPHQEELEIEPYEHEIHEEN